MQIAKLLRRSCWGLALFMAVGTSVGCREALLYDLSWGWPFGKEKDDAAKLAKYGVMPLQRIAELNTISDKIAKAPPEERERLTQELATQIQREMDPIVRIKIMTILAEQKSAAASAVMQAGLRNPDSGVRIACCRAWGKQSSQVAAETLEKVIRTDDDRDVRIAAAASLGSINSPATVTALAAALEDRDIAVQFRAMQSLKQVSGKDYGNDVRKWREFAQGGQPQEPTVSVAERMRGLF